MKNGIKDKYYYELLVWKDENLTEWNYKATHVYGVERLNDLSTDQLKDLYYRIFNKKI
jgi:hypothetical protein